MAECSYNGWAILPCFRTPADDFKNKLKKNKFAVPGRKQIQIVPLLLMVYL